MNTPSTRGFKNVPMILPEGWETFNPFMLLRSLETWGEHHLQPRQGAVGSHVLYINGEATETPEPISYWVLRSNDYSTGRANIRVHMRCVKADGRTEVYELKDDLIRRGVVVDFAEQEVWFRSLTPEGQLSWTLHRTNTIEYQQATGQYAAARMPRLWDQCCELDAKTRAWLISNLDHLREDIEPDQVEALHDLFSMPLLYLAAWPEYLKHLKARVKDPSLHRWSVDPNTRNCDGPSYPHAFQFLKNRGKTLDRDNRIAEDQHMPLYTWLRRSWDFVSNQREPVRRLISLEALLRLHTRWVNRLVDPMYAWRPSATKGDDAVPRKNMTHVVGLRYAGAHDRMFFLKHHPNSNEHEAVEDIRNASFTSFKWADACIDNWVRMKRIHALPKLNGEAPSHLFICNGEGIPEKSFGLAGLE